MSETYAKTHEKHLKNNCKHMQHLNKNTCNICVKYMQYPDKHTCNIRLKKQIKHWEQILAIYVYNLQHMQHLDLLCNIRMKHLKYTYETSETRETCLQHGEARGRTILAIGVGVGVA
jgi:hypothetical protein